MIENILVEKLEKLYSKKVSKSDIKMIKISDSFDENIAEKPLKKISRFLRLCTP